ncbi:S49 family peptidase [Paracoccus sp. p3-h83]|uniref:S49 family peptidase n=1 Tax=Paracoccus sp. p3-h83 TaxID=3342805 RepID=UPI0035B7D585
MKWRIPFLGRRARVSVVRLSGPIGATGRLSGAGLTDAGVAPLLAAAFARKPVAVAIVINSPGGSPVQSSLIAARIRRLADKHDVPVHVFVEDMAASGGYWLACAGDRIWADATSVIGSIGVISAGFGLSDLIARHGIERRVHTAGGSKSFLDPFRPEKPEDVARLKALLEPMHAAFKDWVRSRRGDRLDAARDLFTGDVWVGTQAAELGLIDGIAHLEPKMRELFGDDIRFVTHAARRPWFRRLGVDLADGVLDRAETALRDPGTFSGWR